jgi:hemerythrin
MAMENNPGIYGGLPRGAESDPSFFEWRDSFSVGIPQIDVQHRVLIGFINDANRLLKEPEAAAEMDRVLDNLMDYAKVHFAYEETLLRQSGYALLPEHEREHRGYRVTVERLYQKHRNERGRIDVELCHFLKSWLSDHILKSDMQYAAHLQGYLAAQESS